MSCVQHDVVCHELSSVIVAMSDTVIKQQLSSLFYVRTVCDSRQQQLSDGIADTGCVLPGVRIAVVVYISVAVIPK